jgi:hypothetical protein
MKQLIRLACALMILLAPALVFGQSIEAENTHELSRKARKGSLSKIYYSEEDQTTSLIYVTKFTNKRIKYEIYKFDQNFQFLSQEEVEEEYERYKKRFKVKVRLPKWQREYEGQESFQKEYVSAYRNLTGKLVLYRTRKTYKWSHRWDRFFLSKTEQLEKVKPKVDEDKLLGHAWGFNYEQQLMVTVTSEASGGITPSKFAIAVFNTDLDMKKNTEIELGEPSQLVMAVTVPKKGVTVAGLAEALDFSAAEPIPGSVTGALIAAFKNQPLYDFSDYAFVEGENVYDFDGHEAILIFADGNANQLAPMKQKERAGFVPKPVKYTLVRISNTGDILERKELQNFNAVTQGTLGANANLLFTGQDLYMLFESDFSPTQKVNKVEMSNRSNVRYTVTKLAGASDVAWSTTVTSSDVAANLKNKTAVNDKVKKKLGVFLPRLSSIIMSDGNVFLSGGGVNNSLGILLDAKGKLLGTYQLTPGIASLFSAGKPNAVFTGAESMQYSEKKIYWIMLERGLKVPGLSPKLARIDQRTGAFDGEYTYGVKSKKEIYYLDREFPILLQGAPNTLTFFGGDAKEKKVWFARIKFDE